MIPVAIAMITVSVIYITLTLCSEGWSWLAYRLYTPRSVAVVSEENPFTLDHSKGTVERMGEDGTFQRVACTEDRSVGHQPFYYFLFERKLVQYVFEWEAEGTRWRGHYRYLKKGNSLTVGDTAELHYCKDKPWQYVVKDQKLWLQGGVKLIVYSLLLAMGVILLQSAIVS